MVVDVTEMRNDRREAEPIPAQRQVRMSLVDKYGGGRDRNEEQQKGSRAHSGSETCHDVTGGGRDRNEERQKRSRAHSGSETCHDVTGG